MSQTFPFLSSWHAIHLLCLQQEPELKVQYVRQKWQGSYLEWARLHGITITETMLYKEFLD